jgi:hypothetical protein
MKSALLLLALSAGGAVGCADNDLSLSIVQMEAVVVPMCVAQNTVGIGLSRGTLDVSLVQFYARGYIGVPLVRNNQQSRMPGAGNVEFNSVQVMGANVNLDLPPSAAAKVPPGDQKFYYAASAGRLDPGGLGPMFVELIPVKVANELAGAIPPGGLLTVTAEIRPVAMQQNTQVIGGPMFFPIDLCNGCLHVSQGPCPLPVGTVAHGPGCFPAQDDAQTCCTDSAGNILCGSAAPIKTM